MILNLGTKYHKAKYENVLCNSVFIVISNIQVIWSKLSHYNVYLIGLTDAFTSKLYM